MLSFTCREDAAANPVQRGTVIHPETVLGAVSADLDTETAGDPGVVRRTYRRIAPYQPRGNAEMDSIGWAMFLGILVLLVPLLPFLVVVWILEKAIGAVAGRRGGD
jgi:hypothetical protein